MKHLRLAAGLALSVALIAWLLRSVNLPELGRQLALTDWPWVLPAAAVAPLGVWARAIRWRYLYPPGLRPPGLVAANMIGYMANNILPLRAGELVRVYVAARRYRVERRAPMSTGFWLAAATILVERVLDGVALVLILAVLVLLIPVPATFKWAAVVMLAIDVVTTAVLVALAVAPQPCQRVVARLTRRRPALAARAARAVDVMLQGLDGVRAPSHLLPILAWTLVIWATAALSAWALLRAVHLDLPVIAGWTVLTFVGFGISLPSAPGYVGVWHAANVLALAIFGVSQTQALGYAVLYHASQYVTITLTGWLFLLREHVSLGEATAAPRVGEDAAV
ncbi:MAG TPA: lysylphosphatidylglycerol synthase transmembrane domain-containing protein [Methylomirabilota bacterium]|nr:lysylphosphatidylglycerol synthase transmembrane domain-containing protein [Methylomirabilota bacterium]